MFFQLVEEMKPLLFAIHKPPPLFFAEFLMILFFSQSLLKCTELTSHPSVAFRFIFLIGSFPCSQSQHHFLILFSFSSFFLQKLLPISRVFPGASFHHWHLHLNWKCHSNELSTLFIDFPPTPRAKKQFQHRQFWIPSENLKSTILFH